MQTSTKAPSVVQGSKTGVMQGFADWLMGLDARYRETRTLSALPSHRLKDIGIDPDPNSRHCQQYDVPGLRNLSW